MLEIRFPLSVLLEFMMDVIDHVQPDDVDDCEITVQPVPGVGVEFGIRRRICDDE